MQGSSVRLLALLGPGVLCIRPLVGQAPGELSTASIAARAIPATLTVLTFGESGDTLGQGSGFLVTSAGAFVTNWHVITGATAATVILANGERYDRVLYLDGESSRDVALLKVAGA